MYTLNANCATTRSASKEECPTPKAFASRCLIRKALFPAGDRDRDLVNIAPL
jgi:hypothetical protein